MPDRRLPDSAIDLMDEAAARARLGAVLDSPAPGGAASDAGAAPRFGGGASSGGGGMAAGGFGGEAAGGVAADATEALRQFEAAAAAAGAEVEVGGGAAGPSAAAPSAATATAAPSAAAATATAAAAMKSEPARWADWVAGQGWGGSSEAHRRRLLEWYGAVSAHPLPGILGESLESPGVTRGHPESP